MATNIYLELDGVKGDSTAADGKDQIEIMSFSHGVSMPLTSMAGASGANRRHTRGEFQDFTITKYVDKTSPTLNLKCVGGEEIKKGSMHCWKPTTAGDKSFEFLKYDFENLLVTNVSIGAGGDLPTETVTFNFTKINWTYSPEKADTNSGGKVVTGWDLAENKKV